MKKFLMRIFVRFLRICYGPIKNSTKKCDKIALISRQADAPSRDYQLLEGEFAGRGIETDVLTMKLEGGAGKKIKYFFHIFTQMKTIAAAKVVLLDGYCIVASVLNHREGTTIIQMWHSMGAVKKFGLETIGKRSGSSRETAEIMRMHAGYDYVLAPSEVTAAHYRRSFGVGEEKIKYLGLPGADDLVDEEKGREIRVAIAGDYPNLKKTILYVPTFRKGRKVRTDELINAVDFDSYDLVIKLHPGDTQGENCDERAIYDQKYASWQWLWACDIVITDYSAMAMEAAIMQKPTYFYLYDLSEYEEDPGLNIDFKSEAISDYVFTDARELAKALDEDYEPDDIRAFKNKYYELPCKDATKRLADFAEEILHKNGAK